MSRGAMKFLIAFLIALLLVMGVVAGVSIFFWKKQSSSLHASPTPEVDAQYNMTVSKTCPGAFKTVMEALAAAPMHSAEMFHIHIEAGVYKENVVIPENLTNIVLVGDGAEVTKIAMNFHSPKLSIYDTAAVTILGAGFVAKFITFENSVGVGIPAIAVVIEAKECAFYKCTFLGYQSTLYAKLGRQFFRECDIYGTIDIIFGEAAAVFQNCNLFARVPSLIYFTSQGQRYVKAWSGFVFQNSSFMVAPGFETQMAKFEAYLGTPRSIYSTVVVMESYLSAIVSPLGWAEWPGHSTDKLTYLEYKNRGPGADTSQRVNWTGYRALDRDVREIKQFTVDEFLQGKYWIPRTGITYIGGLIYG